MAEAGALVGRDNAAAPGPVANDDSRPIIRKGLVAIAGFVLVFIVGGTLTPLDAAVVGQGHVAVVGNRQSVQHRDGGIVAKLNVHEGQQVHAGDVLMEIDSTELLARERVLSSQALALRMRESRLQAELDGLRSFVKPEWMTGLSANDAVDADAAYVAQRKEFEAGAGSLRAQNSVLDERIAQLEASVAGTTGEMSSVTEQQELAKSQLADTRSLYERGYSTLSRVRALESSVAELQGRWKSLEGQQNRDRRTVTEINEQRIELLASRRDQNSQELREVQTELSSLDPQLHEVRAQIERTRVRATASGQVVGLSVFTVGGVVSPGQLLMEIVPENANLVIEAMIRPQDAQNVRIGQKAQIRFSIAHARRAPRVFGSVAAVSADQLINEQTGQPYFTVQAELPPEEISRALRAMGGGFEVGPGMPAEVVIPTRGRTALGYLLDPLGDALWGGLREE